MSTGVERVSEVSEADGFFLALDDVPEMISTIGGLYELADEPHEEAVVRALGSLVSMLPRMRSIVVRKPSGRLTWQEDDSISVEERLRVVRGDGGGMLSLLADLASHYSEPWRHDQPLWDCTLYQRFERTFVFLRLNHALGDGLYFFQGDGKAASRDRLPAAADGALLAAGDDGRTPLDLAREVATSAAELGSYGRYVGRVLRGNARQIGAPSAERLIGLIRIPLPEWKAEAAKRGGKVNGLFLAMVAVVLSRYFAEEHGRALSEVNVVMPIDLRGGSRDAGNISTRGQVLLPAMANLPSDLDGVEAAIVRARDRRRLPVGPTAAKVQHLLPDVVRTPLVRRSMQLGDCVATNLRYPRGRMTFASQEVLGLHAIAPATGVPATFCAATYDDVLHLAVTVDTGLVPQTQAFFDLASNVLHGIFAGAEVVHPLSRQPAPTRPMG